jgi:hypothetical protein
MGSERKEELPPRNVPQLAARFQCGSDDVLDALRKLISHPIAVSLSPYFDRRGKCRNTWTNWKCGRA